MFYFIFSLKNLDFYKTEFRIFTSNCYKSLLKTIFVKTITNRKIKKKNVLFYIVLKKFDFYKTELRIFTSNC